MRLSGVGFHKNWVSHQSCIEWNTLYIFDTTLYYTLHLYDSLPDNSVENDSIQHHKVEQTT